MAVINGAFHNGTTTTHVVTVPAGVTPAHRALFVLATGDNVAVTMTPSTSGAGTVVALDSVRQATNTFVGVFEGYGLTAGDTVTILLSISKFADIAHTYDDSIASYGAVAYGTRPASQSSTTSGSTTPAAGQRVRVIGVDRTTVGPTVSSVTSSGGETVTQVDFNHDAASVQPVVGVYFGEFAASASASRTATVTMSSASTNGYCAVIPITAIGLASYNTDHSDPSFVPTSWFDTLLTPGGWFSRSWAPALVAPAGPTQISGTYYSAAPNTVHTITVPTGVTPSMHMVMMAGTGDQFAVTQTATTSGSGKFTRLHNDLAGNTATAIWIGYGLTAGDTITITLSLSKALDIGHWYEDGVTYGYATPAIRPASQSTTTSDALRCASGQRILVLGLDRTATTPTVSSVTSSGGETVTQRDFQHSTSNANVGMYIGEFTASASADRTATVTLSGPSTNGLAALIHVYDASHTAVDAWNSQSPNYVAHRGGSADWVEMTEYAYDQAAAWYKPLALEVSVWRTSDGVWVASHDQTTARMFTTNTDIPSNTWATISGYTTTTGGYPIARLETILDQHQDRVIFVDNKQNTNVTAFLDFLDLYGGKDRIISKGYINSVGTANAANARGYTTWGYLYDADVPSNLPTNAGSWDMLGMDYTGTAPNWATVIGYGKPTLGHIIDTAAAATTSFSRGASGLQVSKITLVVPNSSTTPKSDTDTAAATDGVVARSIFDTDTATATDGVTAKASTSLDTAAATDLVTAKGSTSADSSTGADLVTARAATADDAATATDIVSSFSGGTNLNDTDTATATDAATDRTIGSTDTATATDAATDRTIGSTDTATATDAASLSAALTSTDTAAGTDAATDRALGSVDTATATDAVQALNTGANFNDTDTAAATDAVTARALTATDGATAADTVTARDAGSADTATGSDAPTARSGASTDTATATDASTSRALTADDTATATDAVSSFTGGGNFSAGDTATASDAVTDRAIATTDTAAASDAAGTVTAALSSTDTGAGSDAAVARSIFDTDTASASESVTTRAITALDLATAAEAAALAALLTATDTAATSDAVSARGVAGSDGATATDTALLAASLASQDTAVALDALLDLFIPGSQVLVGTARVTGGPSKATAGGQPSRARAGGAGNTVGATGSTGTSRAD